MQLTTGYRTYLYCFTAGDVRIVCPFSERRHGGFTDIVTPYGFSGFIGNGDCPEFPDQWNIFVRDRGYVCGYIGLHPVFENETYYDHRDVQEYNTIYVLDLSLGEVELFGKLSENRRRQLKSWQGLASNLVVDRSSLKEFLLANYRDFFAGKNAAEAYSFSPDTISFLLDLDNVFSVGIGSGTALEAVSVFSYTPHVGDYLFNVSLPEGRSHSVALLWYAVKKLKSLGVPLLNLGGGIRKDDGVARFKQRFGGRSLSLKHLRQVYNQETFTRLCRQVDADPNDRSGYFPPYLRPSRVSRPSI
jgi:hypothetical protein